MNNKYIKPTIANVMVEDLMDDHTQVLTTSPRVSATGPGQGGDLDK